MTYYAEDRFLDVTLYWGVMGRALFNFTEYLPTGEKPVIREVFLPRDIQRGKISFKYKSDIEKNSDEKHVWETSAASTDSTTDTLNYCSYSHPSDTKGYSQLLYIEGSKLVLTSNGGDPVWGEGGSHDPWKDQGLVPYGEYFNNLQEHVSTQTGFLTVIQTDLYLPGRGLDLTIKRVYAPPSTFEDDQPASAPDYSYQDYPWAPMGNSWQLGFSWIETKDGKPEYIHLSNGQRYLYEGSGQNGMEYHYGDHFKLYNYTNGNYTLYTVDGIRYSFDSSYKLVRITDSTEKNTITFTYSSNKINTITDTIGRTVTFYYDNGLVSQITSGSRTVKYDYAAGKVSGHRLIKVCDPIGRETKFYYFKDYLISRIAYPSGGCSSYTYEEYVQSTYERYRVKCHSVYDGCSNNYLRNTYTYNYADFYGFDELTMKMYSNLTNLERTTYIKYYTISYIEEIWDGDRGYTRIYKYIRYVDSTRRRITIYKYPGNSETYIESVMRYDNWGNMVFSHDFEDHDRYFSYVNTDSTNKFVDSNGQQVYYFSDSFYDNSVKDNIHTVLAGEAEFQNGLDSPKIETYHKYSDSGYLTETKRLLSGDWLKTTHAYDIYGNRIRTVDPNNNTIYYEYNSTYNSAYMTSVNRLLEGDNDENLTRQFGYAYSTGWLTRVIDERANRTDYEYDDLGRATKVVFPSIDDNRAQKGAEYDDTNFYPVSAGQSETGTSTWNNQATFWHRTPGFEAEGRKWVFFYDGSYLVYTSSSDGGSYWETPTFFGNGHTNYDTFFDGTYIHITYSTGKWGSYLYYKRGNPNSDGTITWGSTKVVFQPGSGYAWKPNIALTDDYVWICLHHWKASDNNDFVVLRSNDMNGGWNLDLTTTLEQAVSTSPWGKFAPLTNNKIYVAWKRNWSGYNHLRGKLWDGSSWGNIEIIDDTIQSSPAHPFDLVAWADDVWILWTHSTNDYGKVRRRIYSTVTWEEATNIFNTQGYTSVALSKGKDSNELYAFWIIEEQLPGILYKHFNGSTWDSFSTYLHFDDRADDQLGSLSTSIQPWNGNITVVYAGIENPNPHVIIHDYLRVGEIRDNKLTIHDENNNTIKRYYDGLGRLNKEERYNGSQLYSSERYEYNWLGEVGNYTSPLGHKYQYYYDVISKMIKVVNPDDTYRQSNFYYESNVLEIIDEEGRKKSLVYDWMDRLTDVKEYNTTTNYYHTQYEYDEVGNLVEITDSKGRVTTHQYDQLNRLVQVSYPDETYETISYDAVGNVIEERSRNATYTKYQYDSLDRLLNLTCFSSIFNSSQSEDWLSGWNYRKEITLQGSTAGPQSDYQIKLDVHHGSGSDSAPHIYCNSHCKTDFGDIRFTKSDGTTLLDYWIESMTNGDKAEIWVEVDSIPANPNVEKIYIYYDKPDALTTSNGDDTFVFFDDFEDESVGDIPDSAKWNLTDTNSANDYVKIDNDPADANNKVMHQHEGGSAEGSDYTRVYTKYWTDVGGVVVGYKFRKNLNHYSWQHYMYGIINKAEGIAIFDDACYFIPETTLRYYDGSAYNNYNPSLTISNNVWYEFQYKLLPDSVEFLLDGESRSGEYRNPYGNPRSCYPMTYAKKENNRDAYIDDFWVRKYVSPEPTISDIGAETEVGSIILGRVDSAIYSYDAVGNRISSEWNGTRTTWSYDARNRRVKEIFNVSGDIYSVEYGYDNASNLVSMKYPDDYELSIDYDGFNRITSFGDLTDFAYTLDDRVEEISYGNGVNTYYTYDSRSRPTDILVKRGANTLLSFEYGYDGSGSVTSIYDGTNTETYTYDLVDRLTGTTGPWGTISYTYDEVGNRLKKTAGSTTSYTYDCMNRLTSAGADDYTWDDNGNLVEREEGADIWAYFYDLEDRLTSVRKNGAVQSRFWYDADGRRVRLWDSQDGYLTHVYSGLDVIYESSSSGVTKHFYANGLHVAEVKPGGGSVVTEYYHQDHLGSTRLKTDADGDIMFTRNYEPFGPDYDGSGSEEFKYTGKHEDPSGLYYYGARYYDPEVGRFITEDPVIGSLEDPQGLNRYTYCRINPLKYTDPDGRIPIHIVAGAIAGAVISGFSYYLATKDFKGALVHGAIGAGVGAFTAATFGATALALTPKEPLVVAATAGLGAKGALVAGAVSSGVGGVMERCLEGIAHNLNLPGKHETPTFKPVSFIPDVAGGVIGISAGYGTGIIGSTIPKIRTALDIAIITGEVTEEYAALVIIESTVSEFMFRQTEYLSSRFVFEPQPYHDILPEPWD